MLLINHQHTCAIPTPFRKKRRGPEAELVLSFLTSRIFKIPAGCRLTVFQEPRLECGFPDLVLVVWKPSVAQQWSADRGKLDIDDYKLLQFLINSGGKSCSELEHTLRLRNTSRILKRLEAAETIRLKKPGIWEARPISKIFAAVNIIAVEAKVSEWKRGLFQAFRNTWFTPSSYLLVSSVPMATPLLPEATARGVGICHPRGIVRRPPKEFCRPRSYASWLLNDWAWRAAYGH
jgi:hypothetical protein